MFLMFSSCSIFGDFFLTVFLSLPFLLSVVSLGKQLDASSNSMGNGGAKALGDMISVNKTIQILDVSDNSFGELQVGDEVKIKSSGEMKIVTTINSGGDHDVKIQRSDSWQDLNFEWKSQVPAFCAGVAASPSLTSVRSLFCEIVFRSFLLIPLPLLSSPG